MAKYTFQTMPDIRRTGSNVRYPRMIIAQMTTTRQIAERLQRTTTFTIADVTGLLAGLGELIAEETANGRSVRIDGLGVFRATLAVVPDKTPESPDGTHRNAASVGIRSVKFRPDRHLLGSTAKYCHLERRQEKPHPLLLDTLSQRLEAARERIKRKGFLTLDDYTRLTGMPRTTAWRELQALLRQGKLGVSGRGTHRVFVRP